MHLREHRAKKRKADGLISWEEIDLDKLIVREEAKDKKHLSKAAVKTVRNSLDHPRHHARGNIKLSKENGKITKRSLKLHEKSNHEDEEDKDFVYKDNEEEKELEDQEDFDHDYSASETDTEGEEYLEQSKDAMMEPSYSKRGRRRIKKISRLNRKKDVSLLKRRASSLTFMDIEEGTQGYVVDIEEEERKWQLSLQGSMSESCFLLMPTDLEKRHDLIKDSTASVTNQRVNARQASIQAKRQKNRDAVEKLNITMPILPPLNFDGIGHKEFTGMRKLLNSTENRKHLERRLMLWKKAWNWIENKVNSVLDHLHANELEDIIRFLNSAYESTPRECDGRVVPISSLPFKEIYTALIFAGMNISDHDAAFERIFTHLGRQGFRNMAILKSKDCSNVHSMIALAVCQLMGIQKEANLDEEEENFDEADNEGNFVFSTIILKASFKWDHDMRTLLSWYQAKTKSMPKNPLIEPDMKKDKLIIMLQDVECFDERVLHDFVAICSEYRDKLPIILIFGLATSSEILHNTLSKNVLCLLKTERFYLQHSLDTLSLLIDELFIKKISGCKPGFRSYKYLIDNMLLNNFSINAFISGLKYSVMEHFYSNPLSLLCSEDDFTSDSCRPGFDLLNRDHLTYIRQLPSFKVLVESLKDDPTTQKDLITNDEILCQSIPEFIECIKMYCRNYEVALDVLCEMQSTLGTPSLKKSKRMLYLLGLEENIFDIEHYQMIFKMFTFIKVESLAPFLVRIKDKIDQAMNIDHINTDYSSESFAISNFLDRIQTSLADLSKAKESFESNSLCLTSPHKNSGISSNYQALIKEIKTFLDAFFRSNLICYQHIPLHEIMFYSNAHLLKKAFNPQPLACLQTALCHPTHYLGCLCCPEALSLQHSLPDIAILYQLYREQGRFINIYDWFISFQSILAQDTKKRHESNEIQARFLANISELQLIGLIKPTKKKTDHVIRLNFG